MADYRAGVIEKPETYAVHGGEKPQPQADQVLIRMEGCGVCASNMAVWEGAPWFEYPREPGSPGHEGWGIVETVGSDVHDLQPGERVAALTYHAFATHDLAQADAIVKLPPGLSNVPFPAEPLACAMNIFERACIQPGQQIAVIGIGFLGALLVQLATGCGAQVTAVSRRDFALDTAKAAGAETVFIFDDENIPRAKFDVVIEAVGKQNALDLAADMTAVRGRLVIAGYHQDGSRTVDMQMWNWRGIDVINAHERDPRNYVQGMRKAVQAVMDGSLNPEPFYTHRISLEELPHAFNLMKERPPGFMKALVLP